MGVQVPSLAPIKNIKQGLPCFYYTRTYNGPTILRKYFLLLQKINNRNTIYYNNLIVKLYF